MMEGFPAMCSDMIYAFVLLCSVIKPGFQRDLLEFKLDDEENGPAQLEKIMRTDSEDSLIKLKKSTNLSISLRAVYELVKKHDHKESEFTNLAESTLNIQLPVWWKRKLHEMLSTDNKKFVPGVDGSKRAQNSRLNTGDILIEINPTIAGSSNSICAKNTQSLKLLWTNKVWAVRRLALMGVGRHQVELIASKTQVFVFGAESHGLYFEAFDLNSGKPVLRFCTHYLADR
jgi:hypothetical protein